MEQILEVVEPQKKVNEILKKSVTHTFCEKS